MPPSFDEHSNSNSRNRNFIYNSTWLELWRCISRTSLSLITPTHQPSCILAAPTRVVRFVACVYLLSSSTSSSPLLLPPPSILAVRLLHRSWTTLSHSLINLIASLVSPIIDSAHPSLPSPQSTTARTSSWLESRLPPPICMRGTNVKSTPQYPLGEQVKRRYGCRSTKTKVCAGEGQQCRP